jgi:formate hydrogenlyase subunit 4
MSKALGAVDWSSTGFELALATVTLFVVFLVENSRIPFDDPNTHLELTMIHEVMVLDHSGPDLAFITIAAALKHWILGALVVTVAVPAHSGVLWMDVPVFLAGMTCVALVCGVVESVMARLRLIRVAQLLVGAGGLSALALILGLMR